MKHAKISAVLVALFLLAGMLPCVLQAQSAKQGPMFGTWKLNVAKSDFGGNPKPQAMLVKVESDTADLVQFSVTMTAANGMTFSYSYKGAADGKDYAATGTSSTYSYTETGGSVAEVEKDADGTITKGTFVVLPNGKVGVWTYTVTDSQGNVTHEKLVYDRIPA